MAVHRGLTVRSLLAAGPLPKAWAQGSVISHRAGQVAVAEVRGEPQEDEKVCLFVGKQKDKANDLLSCSQVNTFWFLGCMREREQINVGGILTT